MAATVVATVLAVASASGIAGHEGISPTLAFVLTEATNVVGAAGSGRAVHGPSGPTRMRNSAGAPVTVAVKSNMQFHCSPPADMSSHRLAWMVPVPISTLSTASSTVTGAPAASPSVDPPCDPAHPTHVPSLSRTASANGSVPANGGPAVSTAPALPATAVPLTVVVAGAMLEAGVDGVDDDGAVDSVDAVESLVGTVDPSVVGADPSDVPDGSDVAVGSGRASDGRASRLLEHAARRSAAPMITCARRTASPTPSLLPSADPPLPVSQTRCRAGRRAGQSRLSGGGGWWVLWWVGEEQPAAVESFAGWVVVGVVGVGWRPVGCGDGGRSGAGAFVVVGEGEPVGLVGVAGDAEVAAVVSAVATPAQGDQVGQFGDAAVFAVGDVVHVEPAGAGAPRHPASLIAVQDQPSGPFRDTAATGLATEMGCPLATKVGVNVPSQVRC